MKISLRGSPEEIAKFAGLGRESGSKSDKELIELTKQLSEDHIRIISALLTYFFERDGEQCT